MAELRARNAALRREIEELQSATTSTPRSGLSVEEQAQRYLGEINAAPTWREASLIVGNMVAEVSPERARDIMRAIWAQIDDPLKRRQLLKPFVFGGHPYALEVLHLAATDPEMNIRSSAFFHLRQCAYVDFSEDPAAYLDWRRQYADRPLAEVLEVSLRAFFERLRGADDEGYAKAMRQIDANDRASRTAGVDLAKVATEADMVALFLERLSRPPRASEEERRAALQAEGATWQWMRLVDPEGKAMRSLIEDVLAGPDAHTDVAIASSIHALGGIREPWAFDLLQETLRRGPPKQLHSYLGRAFAEQADERAVPWMIAAIVSDESYDTIHGLGLVGLAKLTGVNYDNSHGAAWWLAWWDKNRDRFAPTVRNLDPRKLALR